MKDDDLRRRLEKLVALRDHPSTLPAIRDEAAKAYDRLNAKVQEAPEFSYYRYRPKRPKFKTSESWTDDMCVYDEELGHHVPFELNPVQRHILREINKQTKKMVFPWNIHKPERG